MVQPGWREIKPFVPGHLALVPGMLMVSQSAWPLLLPQGGAENLWAPQDHNRLVWYWQLSRRGLPQCKHVARSALVPSASEQLSSSPVFRHFSMLELVRECGPRPGVLLLHSGEGASYRPRQKPDSAAASCQGLRIPLKPHSQHPSRGSGMPGFIKVRIK